MRKGEVAQRGLTTKQASQGAGSGEAFESAARRQAASMCLQCVHGWHNLCTRAECPCVCRDEGFKATVPATGRAVAPAERIPGEWEEDFAQLPTTPTVGAEWVPEHPEANRGGR